MEAMQNVLINIRSVNVLISFSETERMEIDDQPEGPPDPGDLGSNHGQVPIRLIYLAEAFLVHTVNLFISYLQRSVIL